MKKILIPIIESNLELSLNAIEYGGALFSGQEPEIIVLYLADRGNYKSKESFQRELHQMVTINIKPKLNKAAARNPQLKKIKLEVKALESEIADHIVEFAEKQGADLIIVSNPKLPGMSSPNDEMDSAAYEVVLKSTCPVLTYTHLSEDVKFEKILLPLDLSEGSKYKTPIAIEIANKFKSRVDILSAIEDPNQNEVIRIEEIQAEVEKMFADKGIECEKEICKMRLDNAVIAKSEESAADLVIIMSRPSSMWSELFITPGAKQIISFSKIPVLIIRLKKWGSGI